MAMRGTAKADVVTLVPVEDVVPALVPGAGPVADLIVREPGGGEQIVGELVLVGQVVVVGMALGLGGQRGSELDRERVGGDVGRVEYQHPFEGGAPVGERLPRSPIDHIEVERRNTGLAYSQYGCDHVGGLMGAPECAENVGDHRLHTDAHPVDPRFAIGAQEIEGDIVGVALHGHLGSGHCGDPRQHLGQLDGVDLGGRSTADENARHRRQVRTGDVVAECLQVGRAQVMAVSPGGEGAVVAAPSTEGDVDVDAEGLGHESEAIAARRRGR